MKLESKRYLYGAAFLSAVFATILVAIGISYRASKTALPKNIILFDVGSTKTLATLFAWENPDSKLSPKFIGNFRCGGPITDVILNKEDTAIYYNGCFANLMYNVSAFSKANTYVYAGSTGGVRAKCSEDIRYCESFKNNSEAAFTKYGFIPSLQSVEVISGEGEAYYGFLAANVFLKHFEDGSALEGTLDLGGATFEVAHEISKNLRAAVHSGTREFSLKERKVKALLQELDCVGVNSARSFYEYNLIKKGEFGDPCLPKDYKINKSIESYKNVCNKDIWDDSIATKYPTVNFTGTSNFAECLKNLGSIFGDSENCVEPSMCLRKKIVTDKGVSYKGLSGFQYTARDYGLNSSSNINEFNKKLQEKCFSQISDPPKRCFQHVYIFFLVKNVLQLDDDKFRFMIAKDIIGWPVGKAFSIKNLENVTYADRILDPKQATYTLIAFGILLAISLVATGIFWYITEEKQEDSDTY